MKNVLIYGGGKSGLSAAKLLVQKENRVFVFDDKSLSKERYDDFSSVGAIVLDELCDDLISKLDKAVISPGVSLLNENVKKLRQKNVKISGEIELGFSFFDGIAVAVTGTNGKTTTVTLIDEMLRQSGFKSVAAGNIGTPFCDVAEKLGSNDICVLETSSFQLDTTEKFCPHIAALLNIQADHIDSHGSMENYVNAKKKIFTNQSQSDYAVINADDEICLEISKNLKSKLFLFSVREKTDGAYLKDGVFYLFGKPIVSQEEINLKGLHNAQNILCALTVCGIMGVTAEQMAATLKSFLPPPHRMQKVGKIGDVLFVDDSKATNASAALPAMASFEKVSVILGGSDKNCGFDELFKDLPENVRYCVLTGDTQNKLFESAKKYGFKNLFFAADFKNAVEIAYHSAKPDGTVLLSPACASFDCFKNYAERGEKFCEIFRCLKDEKS